MTSKKYFVILFIAMFAMYGVHFCLLHSGYISYNWSHFNLFDIIVFLIFLGGGLIIAPAFKQEAEKFVMKFMVLTTVQLLSVLAIIAAALYSKIPSGKLITFNIIGMFVVLLIVQSVVLVRGLSKK